MFTTETLQRMQAKNKCYFMGDKGNQGKECGVMAYIDKAMAIKKLTAYKENHLSFPKSCLGMIDTCITLIKIIPTADVVEVVRCSDCLHYDFHHHQCDNPSGLWSTYMDGFCSHGERRDA